MGSEYWLRRRTAQVAVMAAVAVLVTAGCATATPTPSAQVRPAAILPSGGSITATAIAAWAGSASPAPSSAAIGTPAALTATPATAVTAPPLQAFVEPAAASVTTIFTTFAGATVTVTEGGVAGTSVQFQQSTDLVTWLALATVPVDASGRATYSFRPVRTAYYRAYSYATGALSSPARGIVVAFGLWTGYTVAGGPFRAVTGTFTVPNLVVPTTTAMAVAEWVGIDGIFPDTSLIQAGVSETTAPGSYQVAFQPWWEILPDDPAIVPIDQSQLSVIPGDEVTVTIWQASRSTWMISLTDARTGQTYTTPPEVYRGPTSSVEWIVEAPANTETGSVFPLGEFMPDVTFSNARYLDAPTAVGHPTSEELPPIVQAGATVAVPSTLSAGGFRVAYGAGLPSAP